MALVKKGYGTYKEIEEKFYFREVMDLVKVEEDIKNELEINEALGNQ